MSDQLIDQFVDTAGITADKQFLLNAIAEIVAAYDKLNSIKVNLAGASAMNDIVKGSSEAKKAVDTLAASTDKLLKSEILSAKVAKENATAQLAQAKATQAAAKSAQDKAKADQAEAKAIKDLAAAEKLEAQAKKELAAAARQTAQARNENAKAALTEQRLQNGNARAQEKKQLQEIGYAYNEYSKAAREASLRAKAYALTLGEADPRTQAAIKNAKEMNDTLKRVDASVGQFGREVGNYKTGFDGLSHSFTQISRELPSLAVSFQTFALAVSNNLPMVVDEVAKAGKEVKELRAQGEQTPGVFKRMLTSALSLNVGISIAIALFTAYAGKVADWVTEMFSAEARAKKQAQQQQLLNKAVEEGIELQERYNKDVQRFDGTDRKLQNDLLRARARGASEKEVLEIEKELLKNRVLLAQQDFDLFGKGGGEAKMAEFKKQLDTAKEALDDYRRSLRGDEDKEDVNKQTQFLKDNFELAEKAFLRQKGIVEEYYNANRDLEVKDLEIKKLAGEQTKLNLVDITREIQARQELNELINQEAIARLKVTTDNPDANSEVRVKGLQESLRLEKQIIRDRLNAALQTNAFEQRELQHNLNQQLADTKKSEEEKQVLRAQAATDERALVLARQSLIETSNKEILEADTKFISDRGKIYSEAMQRLLDDEQATRDGLQELQDEAFEKAQSEVARRGKSSAEGSRIEITALNKEYAAKIAATRFGSREREKVEREYAEKRAEIEYQYALSALKNQVWLAEQTLKIKGGTFEDEKRLSELRQQLSDLETQHIISNNEKEAKHRKEKLKDIEIGIENIKTAYTATTDFIGGLLQANIDKQKNEIEDQIEGIEKKKKADIEAINASAKTEEEKAHAIAVIEAQAAADKEAAERRQRQLDIQKAKFDRAVAIGNIILNTALAVVKALPNIPQAVAVGAIGAAQLAVALAQPIPKFKHGRDGGAATMAIVGDGGVSEVVTSPDLSQAYVTPNTDTLTYLKKDWKVFPSMNAFKEAALGMSNAPQLTAMPVAGGRDNSDVVRALKGEIGSLRDTVRNKQETHMYWKNGEMYKAFKKAKAWEIYRNNNF